jgi:hypothetical protein
LIQRKTCKKIIEIQEKLNLHAIYESKRRKYKEKEREKLKTQIGAAILIDQTFLGGT